MLYRNARAFLAAKFEGQDFYPYIIATLPDSVIVSAGYGGAQKCYRISWAMDDGKPTLKGEAKEVVVKPAVIEKMLAGGIGRPAAAGSLAAPDVASLVKQIEIAAMNDDPAALPGMKRLGSLARVWEQQNNDAGIEELIGAGK